MITCIHCHFEFSAYLEKIEKNSLNKYVIRASCPSCLRYLKWLRFSDSKILSPSKIEEMYKHNMEIDRERLS